MKTYLFCLTRTLAAASLLSQAFGSSVGGVQLPSVPLGFDIVYKLKAYTPPTVAQTNALAGLSGIPVTALRTPRKLGTVQYFVDPVKPTNFFNLDLASGAISFSHDLSKYEGDFAPALPQTDEEAERIATGYLTTNKLMPVLGTGESMVLAGVQTVGAGRPRVVGPGDVVGGGAANAVSFAKLKIVTFRRIIYGLPVIGPGSKIVVTIGDQNAVEGVIVRWRPFIPPAKPPIMPTGASKVNSVVKAVATTVPVITPEAALADLQGRLRKEFSEIDVETLNTMIQSMNVGLYDSNVGAIQPVYVYQLDLRRKSTVPLPGTDHQELFLTASPYLKTPPEALIQLGDLPNNPAPRATSSD